jgi:hypothetical protein
MSYVDEEGDNIDFSTDEELSDVVSNLRGLHNRHRIDDQPGLTGLWDDEGDEEDEDEDEDGDDDSVVFFSPSQAK